MPRFGLSRQLSITNRRGGGIIANGAGQSFNGTDQYVFVADNGDLDIAEATTDFCFGGYVNTSDDITSFQSILGKDMNDTPNGRYGFYINAGTLSCRPYDSDGSYIINDNITLNTNTKYHLVVRIDLIGKKIYFYIDGVLQNAGGRSFTGTFANLDNGYEFKIGCANDRNPIGDPIQFFKGNISDVRIYHKDVSSSADQAKWMNGEALGDEIAWWNLPTLTGFGGTSYDLTGVNL